MRAAAGLLSEEEVRLRERKSYDIVFVDEYQDTDPAQEYLLQQLAGEGRDLIAVGDPDQSIYGFRGADVRGILEFPRRFPTIDGDRAPIVALQTCRRMGPVILEASRRIARKLPGMVAHRDLQSPDTAEEGEVHVVIADSTSQESALVADELRRAHLLDGVPWSRMAVLVRSAVRQVPVLRPAPRHARGPPGVPPPAAPPPAATPP